MRRWWSESIELRILATAVAVLLVAGGMFGGLTGFAQFWISFVAGLFGLIVVAAWAMPAQSKEDDWRRGAEGEVATARALDHLSRSGWRAVHDRSREFSNIDHIVVGPGGVFVVDTKNWNGDSTEDPEEFETLGASSRFAANEINDHLKVTTDSRGWVHAVVAFWGDFEDAPVKHNSVTYLSGDQLIDWFRGQPAKLSGVEVDRTIKAIQEMPPGAKLSLQKSA
jgi:hypothetical protein